MKIPAGRAQHVLYLDFDGVLHPEDVYHHPRRGLYFGGRGAGHELFENAPLLAAALEPYPDVSIVLSTSWVRAFKYSRAKSYLPPALRQRVIGATFHTAMVRAVFEHMSRAQQILADVYRRRPVAWLAIDDDCEEWPEDKLSQLVASDPVLGCSAPAVHRELEMKLAALFGGEKSGPSEL